MALNNNNPPMPPPADLFAQDVDDILQGRIYYTICCHSPSGQFKCFRWKRFKICLICALVILIFFELVEMVAESSPRRSCRGRDCLLSHEYEDITLYNLIRNSIEGKAALNPIIPRQETETELEGQSEHEEQVQVRIIHWNGNNKVDGYSTLNEREDQDNYKAILKVKRRGRKLMSNVAYIHKLSVEYICLVLICFLVSLISGLVSVARDVFVRHLIAVKRQSLIANLLQFRRVRYDHRQNYNNDD